MSEHMTLAKALQEENTEATTARNAFKAKHKPWHKWAPIVAASILLLSSVTSWYQDYSAKRAAREAQRAEAALAVQTEPLTPRGSDMVYLELAKGHCSEAIAIPRGQNADYWFLEGTLWMEARPSRNSEWTRVVTGTVSQIRFCGDGRVSYQFRPS